MSEEKGRFPHWPASPSMAPLRQASAVTIPPPRSTDGVKDVRHRKRRQRKKQRTHYRQEE